MTICSLDVLLSLFGTSLLFHVQFQLLLPDLHLGSSRGRSGGLVFPSLSEFSQFIVIHIVKGFGLVNKAEIDVFLELSCFFHDPADVGNLISGSSAFSKTSLNIRKFTVHVHPLPTTQEKTLYMDITRWSTPKSDWLYSLQPEMEKLYTVNKNKTRSWLWLRPWTPYCQIQT